jgi:hypothetical protein
MRTNKQINAETTSVLYGENFITIKISHAGIFVESTRCGNYAPWPKFCVHWKMVQRHKEDLSHLVWPSSIRKAQFISVQVDDDGWQGVANMITSRMFNEVFLPRISTSACDVIWSLCIELAKENSCRVLDIEHPADGHEFGVICHPLRMLGGVTSDIDAKVEAKEMIESKKKAKEIRKGSLIVQLTCVKSCMILLWRIFCWSPRGARYLPTLSRIAVGCTKAWICDSEVRTMARLTAIFLRSFVFELRVMFDNCEMPTLPNPVMYHVHRVLLLEVEMEISTRTKRLGRASLSRRGKMRHPPRFRTQSVVGK